jgi:hypothetical protein
MNVNELLSKDSDFIIKFLHSINMEDISSDFNWLGLGEISELNASQYLQKNMPDEGMRWLKIALFSYDFLSKKNPVNSDIFSYEIKIARVRVQGINYFGVSNNNDLLDFNFILHWFFSFVDALPITKKIKLCDDWKKLERGEILRLRKIKNAINVIDEIKDKVLLKQNPSIMEWMNIKNKLP